MEEKKAKTTLLFLGLIGFLTNGDIYSGAPLLVEISTDLNISLSTAALSMTSYMLAFGLFTIILGPMGDRFGKTKIIVFSSFGTAIFSCLCIFAKNIEVLIFLRALNGAFAAGIMPISMAIAGEIFEGPKKHGAIAKLMGAMFLGGASATAIGGSLAYFASWQTVYLTYGVAELLVAFGLLATLEKRPGTLKELHYIRIYSQALKNGKLVSILFLVFMSGFAVYGSFTYSGELIKQATGFTLLSIGLILSFFGIGGVVGSRVAEQVKKKLGLNICLISGVFGGACIYIMSFTSSVPVLILCLFGLGLFFIFVHSTNVTTAQSIIPSLRGTAMALVSFCMFVGSGLGTIVYNQVLEYRTITNIFIEAGILFLCLGVACRIVLGVVQQKMK